MVLFLSFLLAAPRSKCCQPGIEHMHLALGTWSRNHSMFPMQVSLEKDLLYCILKDLCDSRGSRKVKITGLILIHFTEE